MSKDEILERYLNTVYFGNGVYGVQAAAELYFGKNVGDLGWPEAAMLAALIRDPRDYDPFTNPALAIERRHLALQRLVETGNLTQGEADLYTLHAAAERTVAARRAAEGLLRRAGEAAAARRSVVQPRVRTTPSATTRCSRAGCASTRRSIRRCSCKPSPPATTRCPDRIRTGCSSSTALGGTSREDCPALNDGDGHCLGTIAMVSVDPATGAVRNLVGGPGFDKWKYDLATQATPAAGLVDEGVRARRRAGERHPRHRHDQRQRVLDPESRRHARPVHAEGRGRRRRRSSSNSPVRSTARSCVSVRSSGSTR